MPNSISARAPPSTPLGEPTGGLLAPPDPLAEFKGREEKGRG